MILVVGATGMVGSELCRLFTTQGMPLRAMVRESSDPAKVEKLKDLGAKIVKGNLCDPDSLKAACQGAEAVICTVSAMPFCYKPGVNEIQSVDFEGVINLIEAAKVTGVKQFIYTSFSGNLDRDFPLRNAKRAVEKHLKESGLIYTILRPSMFMEVWLSPAVGFDCRQRQGDHLRQRGTADRLDHHPGRGAGTGRAAKPQPARGDQALRGSQSQELRGNARPTGGLAGPV